MGGTALQNTFQYILVCRHHINELHIPAQHWGQGLQSKHTSHCILIMHAAMLIRPLQALIEEFETKLTEYAAERAEEERTAEAARLHAERRRGGQLAVLRAWRGGQSASGDPVGG